MARHLGQRRTGRTHQLTRGVVDLVVAAQVARVVVGDALAERCDRNESLLAHETVEQLRVVDDLVLRAQLRVLVAQCVEAVRTGDDDLLALLGRGREDLAEHLDVLLREHLEEELVAGTSCGVTGTGLALAEDHEVHRGHVEELGDGLGGLLRAVLVSTGTADPEQVLEALERLDVLAEDRDLDVHLVDPGGARGGVLAPRVALVLEVLEHAGQLGREVRLDQDLVAAHVEDVVDVLDVDRALLDARTAGGAAPQGLGVDDGAEGLGIELTLHGFDDLTAAQITLGLADELARRLGARRLGDRVELVLEDVAVGVDEAYLVAAHVLAATGEQVRGLGVAVVAQRHDEQLRAQRLAGVPGRTLRLAATTLGTRGEVEPALPREVLDLAGAERVDIGIGGLHVEDLALAHHRLRGTEGDAAVLLALEVDVEEGRETVPGNAPADVHADHGQPDHAAHQLDHGEDRHQRRRGREDLRDLHGEEVGVCVRVAVGRDLRRLDQDHAQALEQHDDLDEVGRSEARTAEARQPLGDARVVELADHDQHDDADDGGDAEQLVPEVPREGVTEDGPVELRVDGLSVGLEPQQESTEEADHHEPVRPADGAELDHPRVDDEFLHHRQEAREDGPEAGAVDLVPELDGAEDPHHATEEQVPAEEADHRGCRADGNRRGSHGRVPAFRLGRPPPVAEREAGYHGAVYYR